MDPNLPPCEQAQADGVPCTELGRDCEICEFALNPPGAEQADGSDEKRPDPVDDVVR